MKKSDFLRWYLPPILWGAIILILTSIPKLEPPDFGFELQDKFAHFAIYYIFGLVLIRGWAKSLIPTNRVLLSALLFATIFGALDETHQLLVPGRTGDLFDFIADSLGILLAGLSFWLLRKYLPNGRN